MDFIFYITNFFDLDFIFISSSFRFLSQMTTHQSFPFYFLLSCFLMFIYLERERESTEVGEQRERERKRISSRLHVVSAEPNAGLELTNREIMT